MVTGAIRSRAWSHHGGVRGHSRTTRHSARLIYGKRTNLTLPALNESWSRSAFLPQRPSAGWN